MQQGGEKSKFRTPFSVVQHNNYIILKAKRMNKTHACVCLSKLPHVHWESIIGEKYGIVSKLATLLHTKRQNNTSDLNMRK